MAKRAQKYLSRRERQIMDIVYQLGEASVADVVSRIEDRPSYDTVRVTLGILAKKGHLKYRKENRRHIFTPTVRREEASRSAVRSLLRTFFEESPSKAILAMLDSSSAKLSKTELDEIEEWIQKEKQS